MQLIPYLTFDGRCEEAVRLYAECLGGRIDYLLRYGESSMAAQFPAEMQSKVFHATLSIGGIVLQAADSAPELYQRPQGFSININLRDPAEADRVFGALSEGGTVTMPLAETFWAKRFGTCTDRFGIPWIVNCGESS